MKYSTIKIASANDYFLFKIITVYHSLLKKIDYLIKHYCIILYAIIINYAIKILQSNSVLMKILFIPNCNELRNFNASARAYYQFVLAKKNIPAYNKFLEKNNFTKIKFNGWLPIFKNIPTIDKENYIKKYTIAERCINGKIPNCGVVFDESSGSSGIATNWVRGYKERKINAKYIQFGIEHNISNKPLFIINAFALGAWATGVNVTMACVGFSKLKSLGPDKTKIINTIQEFGNSNQYLILGYPPFLKLLIDDCSIDWHQYNISFILGGESMGEGMRNYFFEKGIKKVYSSLGASDVELNIAAENDFTINIRKILQNNLELRKKLFENGNSLPMVFQYNPSDFLMQTNANDELIITVCRPDYIAPKIRYNLYDKVRLLSVQQLYKMLNELNIDISDIIKPIIDLPLLFHYGRANATVSFFGANICMMDVQEVIDRHIIFSKCINSFYIHTLEDEVGNKILDIQLELNDILNINTLETIENKNIFFDILATINQDFREAKKMVTNNKSLQLNFFKYGSSHFSTNDIRIKSKYID